MTSSVHEVPTDPIGTSCAGFIGHFWVAASGFVWVAHYVWIGGAPHNTIVCINLRIIFKFTWDSLAVERAEGRHSLHWYLLIVI